MGQLPAHSHPGQGVSGVGSSGGPSGQVWAGSALGDPIYLTGVNPSATMAPAAIAATGGGRAHENRQPYLVVNFIIALVGIFPSRN
jgi:microcystin-dependent protein